MTPSDVCARAQEMRTPDWAVVLLIGVVGVVALPWDRPICHKNQAMTTGTVYQSWVAQNPSWWLVPGVHGTGGYNMAVVSPMKHECMTKHLNLMGGTTKCWIAVNEYGCRLNDDGGIEAFLDAIPNRRPTPGIDRFCDASHPRVILRAVPLVIRSLGELEGYYTSQIHHREFYRLSDAEID